VRKYFYCKTYSSGIWLSLEDQTRDPSEHFLEQHSISGNPAVPRLNQCAKRQSLTCLFPNCITCADKASCVSGVNPRQPPVPTHCMDSTSNCIGLGFCVCLAALTKRTSVLFKTLMIILQSSSQRSSGQTHDENRQNVTRDCNCPAVHVLRLLQVSGLYEHVVHTQTEQHRGDELTLVHPNLITRYLKNGRNFRTFVSQDALICFSPGKFKTVKL
jgi:hypothetical protein